MSEKDVITDKYKLLFGDCFERLKEIPDNSIDAVITDPPYSIDFLSNRTNNHEKIKNDDIPADELFRKFMPDVKRVLKEEGVACICCAGGGRRPTTALATLESIKYLDLVNTVVWSKGKNDGSFVGLGWRYRPSYETVLILAKNYKKMAWYQKTNDVSNVFTCKPTIPSKYDHPTPKPIKLMEFFIRNHTKEGDTVLDMFMGGGTTGVACMRLNRKFIGIEIEEKFFDMAHKRISEEAKNSKLKIFFE
jgi:site-specific DNA-methyltransferase (adenine-specific)